LKRLRTAAFMDLGDCTSHLPDKGRGAAIGYREGDGAGGLAMMSHVASERAIPQLECDRQPLAITLADRPAAIGRVLGNSYDVGHGSYPR
jgi:hypothetical protein